MATGPLSIQDSRWSWMDADCCYRSMDIGSDDEVPKALAECAEKAASELGTDTEHLVLVTWFWEPKWVGTVWRRL